MQVRPELLKEGCEKFVQEFESITKINPLIACVTIASACNLFWRKKLLKADLTAVEPVRGWRGCQVNQSEIALQWLYYQDGGTNRIRHLRNGGEQCVLTPAQSYFVDGYDAEKNNVYEFHYCIYHGCKKCFPRQRENRRFCHPDRSVNEVFEATERKRAQLRQVGYTVVEMWECDFKKAMKTDPDLIAFLKEFELVEPLNPRKAFFGGRTGATTLHFVAGPDEEIKYVDVTSLYPFVNKNRVYPVGQPEIFTNPADQDIQNWFGVALVDILAPERLYHPVLPVKINGKLTFLLCASCIVKQQKEPWLEKIYICAHKGRQLRGVWTTPEIIKARKKGTERSKYMTSGTLRWS